MDIGYPTRFAHTIQLSLLTLLLASCSGADVSIIEAEVSGKVQYEDRQYGAQGFTGKTSFKAVRFAPVELVDGSAVIDKTTTNEFGQYHLSGKGAKLYVRVLTQSDADVGASIAVHNFDGAVYAVTRPVSVEGEQQIDFEIGVDRDVVGAFNILDVYTSSARFVSSLTNKSLPPLAAHWQPKSSRYGTYFCSATTRRSACPAGKGIYLYGGSPTGGDTDEFDDDVLLHEYGHYIESMLGVQDSPGGVHYLTDNDSDLRLAWSEGWGGFFPGAVKTWLKETDPSLLSAVPTLPNAQFVDTYGNFAAISIDMSDPGSFYCFSGSDCFSYSTSEVAVANVLNGFMAAFDMQAVWDSMGEYIPNDTVWRASLETFWDGWVAQRSPSQEEYATLYSVLNDRKIYYNSDSFESDDDTSTTNILTPCSDVNCSGQRHYLYQGRFSSDVDHVLFYAEAGRHYSVETLDLANGADTFLRILSNTGDTVMGQNGLPLVNDDRPGTVYCYPLESPCKVHNDDVMLSSLIDFTPNWSGSYAIEITTAVNRPAAAGRYGTYSLKVVEHD